MNTQCQPGKRRWPEEKCSRCIQKGLPCSEPQRAKSTSARIAGVERTMAEFLPETSIYSLQASLCASTVRSVSSMLDLDFGLNDREALENVDMSILEPIDEHRTAERPFVSFR